MSKGLILGLSITAIFMVLIFSTIGSYVSNANYGNEAEKQLTAQYTDNQNVLSTYYNKVEEIVQVTDKYKDGLKEVVTAAIQGRYGSNGSQATMQWLKEANVNLDPSLYSKLAQVMEAGRNEFKNSQSILIDMKRGYTTNLGYVYKGFWLHMAGYPKINLDNIKIVTSGESQKVFETGVENSLKLSK